MIVNKQHLKYLSFGLTGLMVLVLIVATILEKVYGTSFVMKYLYASPVVIVLWGIIVVSSFCYLLKAKLYRQAATFCLHLSFMLILAGALVTHLFGRQGTVHLRQDAPAVNAFMLTEGTVTPLPFQVSLKAFQLVCYMGTSAPMDFVSTLLIEDNGEEKEVQVSMNRIYSHRHYRFYQSGYDRDGKGTILAVSHDPYGIGITYTGYAMLLLSMLSFFFQKDSAFRRLLRHPLLRKGTVCLWMLCAVPSLYAAPDKGPKVLPADIAAQFGDLYVYYNDRICPLQTLAKDFTVKLCGKTTYKGLTPEQVLTGWFFYYTSWKEEPVIRIKGKEAQRLLGIDGGYASLKDYVDINGYKLEAALQDTDVKHQDVEAANEKFNLISMVSTGGMFYIYPYRSAEDEQPVWYSLIDKLPVDMPDDQWAFVRNSMNYVAEKIAAKKYDEASVLLDKIKKYQRKECVDVLPSDNRFQAEKLYNQFVYSKLFAIVCICIGLVSFICFCRCMVAEKRAPRWMVVSLNVLLLVVFVYLSAAIVLRGYVSNHLPLSNGFETMQFMAWTSLLLTFLLQRKFSMVLPFGFLLCGLTLMVSMLGEANPKITQLMPVLQSPLLSIHVVVIMIAYSLLAFVMLNGVTAVILQKSGKECGEQVERLQVISRIILYPAVFLLAIGIFIGAVWANVSWGRYWGWDPKEVWALITMLVYAAALHVASLSRFRSPMFFHVFCIVAFLTVLITYFGVNFLLGGMHSYANG